MKDSKNDGVIFGQLGPFVFNVVILMFAAHWMAPAFTGLPAEVLDKTFPIATVGFIVAIQSCPRGWPDWFRLTAGIFLLNGATLMAALLVALAISVALPTGYLASDGKTLLWIGLFPVFLLMLPLAVGLGRIGLLPAFRWDRDEPEARGAGASDETPPGPPTWFPPGAGRRLPSILAIIGIGIFGAGIIERLALAWPNSILSAIDPRMTAVLMGFGGFAGFFHAWDKGWPALLATTLLSAAAVGGIAVGLALPPYLWPEVRSGAVGQILELLPALLLLLLIILAAYREFRRDKERRAQATAASGEGAGP